MLGVPAHPVMFFGMLALVAEFERERIAHGERQRLLDRLLQLDAELEQARAALATARAARRPLAWLLPWRI